MLVYFILFLHNSTTNVSDHTGHWMPNAWSVLFHLKNKPQIYSLAEQTKGANTTNQSADYDHLWSCGSFFRMATIGFRSSNELLTVPFLKRLTKLSNELIAE